MEAICGWEVKSTYLQYAEEDRHADVHPSVVGCLLASIGGPVRGRCISGSED